jgi:acetyl esterase/lipase
MSEPIKANRIFYGDNENQYGDLRLPLGNGPYPVAIVIHGGFWRNRVGLDIMDRMADDLTSRGIATWNIEYRRVGQEGGGWPGTFIDVAKAAEYLHTLVENHSLDLNRVITIGHSAGGHLALWLAARHRLSAESTLKTTDNPLPIHGAVSLAGVVDLALMQEVHQIREVWQNLADKPVSDLVNGNPDEVPERYAETSPIQMLPIEARQLLIHGSLDINVPIGISLSYKKAAEQAGSDIKMVEIPTVEHFKVIDPDSEAWPIIITELMKLF